MGLESIPKKYFEGPFLSGPCPFCKTRMVHPSEALFICPNEKCGYKYRFYPESKGKPVEVISRSKLEMITE